MIETLSFSIAAVASVAIVVGGVLRALRDWPRAAPLNVTPSDGLVTSIAVLMSKVESMEKQISEIDGKVTAMLMGNGRWLHGVGDDS